MFADIGDKALGTFDPNTNEIEINSKYKRYEQYSAIRHEIQHLIQEREGFARGASPEREGMARVEQRIRENKQRIAELNTILRAYPKNAQDYDTLVKERNNLEVENTIYANDMEGASDYFL